MTNQVVIYSHGFGVRKDDRGMFTDIAAALPGVGHVMFDYNDVADDGTTLTAKSLTVQARVLGSNIADVRSQNPDASIDIIAHSQGCVVAAMLKPSGIRKAIFIGAPAELRVDDMMRLFAKRPGSELDMSGTSTLIRADFSHTLILPDYWSSIQDIDPVLLYNAFSAMTDLVLVNATQDEVIGSRDFGRLARNIQIFELKTGHNFDGNVRPELVGLVKQNILRQTIQVPALT